MAPEVGQSRGPVARLVEPLTRSSVCTEARPDGAVPGAHWHQDSAIDTHAAGGVAVPLTEGPEIDASDESFHRAIETVVRSQRVSVSLLQRDLKLEHEKARKLVMALESAGIVSAPMADGVRRVLRGATRPFDARIG